eukprot:532573-Hanusia_phi.AAC.2
MPEDGDLIPLEEGTTTLTGVERSSGEEAVRTSWCDDCCQLASCRRREGEEEKRGEESEAGGGGGGEERRRE